MPVLPSLKNGLEMLTAAASFGTEPKVCCCATPLAARFAACSLENPTRGTAVVAGETTERTNPVASMNTGVPGRNVCPAFSAILRTRGWFPETDCTLCISIDAINHLNTVDSTIRFSNDFCQLFPSHNYILLYSCSAVTFILHKTK